MGLHIYNLCTVWNYSNRILLIEKKNKQKKKNKLKKKENCYPCKRSESYLLIWSAYNLQKNFNKLNGKLFHVTDINDQIIQKHTVNLGSK